MGGSLLAGNANGWLGAGGDSSLAALVGTGVVEVTGGVPSVFPVPTTQIPFGRSANDGLLTSSSNLTFNGSSQTLVILGAAGNVTSSLDRPAVQLVKGSGNTTSAGDVWGGAIGSGGEFLWRFYQYGDKPDYAGGTDRPKIYINNGGYFFGDTAITLSGDVTGTGQNYRINPPNSDSAMLKIWSDVAGPAVVIRCTGSASQNIVKALDRDANVTGLWGEYGVMTLGPSTAGQCVLTPGASPQILSTCAATDQFPKVTAQSSADGYSISIVQCGSTAAGTIAGVTLAGTCLLRAIDSPNMLINLNANGTISFAVNSAVVIALTDKVLSVSNAAGYIDLTAITAGNSNMKVRKTTDTPATTYTAHVASTDPAGYIEIRENAGGATPYYIPFFT